MSREIYVIFMKLRLDSVAVREINCALSVKYYSVVGRNVELEHKAVDLGFAVSAYRNDVSGVFVQHFRDFLRCIITREIVSRTVIQYVAEENELIRS